MYFRHICPAYKFLLFSSQDLFAGNVRRIEEGEEFDNLPSIDPQNSLSELGAKISALCGIDLALTSRTPGRDDPLCSSSGAASVG